MPLYDWQCPIHGDFEGSHAICPEMGCLNEDIIKVYRKAPGIVTARTRRVDRTVRQLASEHGLSDLNNRHGQAAARPADSMLWGNQSDTLLPAALRGQGLFSAAKTPTPLGEDTNGLRTAHAGMGRGLMSLRERTRAGMDHVEIPHDDPKIRAQIKESL